MVAVKGCVPEKNYEIFEALRGWIESVLGHVCKDDGAHIVYDRVKHEKCTNELGGYIFECAALNIINKQYDDRKALTDEDCGYVDQASRSSYANLNTYPMLQFGGSSQGLPPEQTIRVFSICCCDAIVLR